jgi:hypothetical protein
MDKIPNGFYKSPLKPAIKGIFPPPLDVASNTNVAGYKLAL